MVKLAAYTVGLAAGLAACATAGAPAPVDMHGDGLAQPVRPTAEAPSAGPIVLAAPGPAPAVRPPAPPSEPEDWAAGPGTPLSTWALRPEEAQPYDPRKPPKTHLVADGDTLYAISARYQVPLRALIEGNRLEAPFALREGETLALPAPRRHAVKPGETLVSIAARYNVDARSLALLNRMAKPYTVRLGEALVLPALARGPAAPEPAPAPPEAAPAPSPGAVRPALPPKPGAKPVIRLAWPVEGKILAGFGAQPGGKRSDGVDIAATPGAPIKAAADGMVVYAGDDLPGYGNLMLVQHGGGVVTAYAQARSLTRREGQKVRQGEVIGEVAAQDSGPARLHFQVRAAGRPADPLAMLPAKKA